jgi:hypothetical protein
MVLSQSDTSTLTVFSWGYLCARAEKHSAWFFNRLEKKELLLKNVFSPGQGVLTKTLKTQENCQLATTPQNNKF